MIDTLRKEILNWYQINGRSLPWRETNDPYKIWLSEIILQQTRVNQGMPYYFKFIEKYPTIEDLANANEQEVMNTWQGLGYYSRARNLHAAAKMVVNHFKGEFPTTYKELLKLKGVGAYTAAAISSAAFNEAAAVLDGNVFRVIARLYNIDENIADQKSRSTFQKIADELLDKDNPGEFNQAMMDFGAMQCTPKTPACIVCPLATLCKAQILGLVNERPVKIKKLNRKTRYLHYFFPMGLNAVPLKKRESKDIWQGLFEPPLIETKDQNLDTDLVAKMFGKADKPNLVFEKIHKLTHQDLVAKFYQIDAHVDLKEYVLVNKSDLENYPIPRLIELYFEFEGDRL